MVTFVVLISAISASFLQSRLFLDSSANPSILVMYVRFFPGCINPVDCCYGYPLQKHSFDYKLRNEGCGSNTFLRYLYFFKFKYEKF